MLKNNSLMHQFVKPWLAGELSVLLALEKIFSGSELTPSHISLFFLSRFLFSPVLITHIQQTCSPV